MKTIVWFGGFFKFPNFVMVQQQILAVRFGLVRYSAKGLGEPIIFREKASRMQYFNKKT